MYTTSTAFLEALNEAGISYIFANFGSDHPALLEAIAEARASGRKIPAVVTAPNEMVGMSAAHGFAQVTGQPQLVLVHVECGTQALAGAVHNAARGHVPMLIFAGASPFTQDGEMRGSRNEFIQWIQDVHDQRGIIRGYTKYDAEIRTGENIKQVVHRALQFTSTDPKGPVYLMGAREVMEADIANPVTIDPRHWRPVDPGALTVGAIDRILDHVEKAKRPLLVTSYADATRTRLPNWCASASASAWACTNPCRAPSTSRTTTRSIWVTSGTSRTRTRRSPRPTLCWWSTATCPGSRPTTSRPMARP